MCLLFELWAKTIVGNDHILQCWPKYAAGLRQCSFDDSSSNGTQSNTEFPLDHLYLLVSDEAFSQLDIQHDLPELQSELPVCIKNVATALLQMPLILKCRACWWHGSTAKLLTYICSNNRRVRSKMNVYSVFENWVLKWAVAATHLPNIRPWTSNMTLLYA